MATNKAGMRARNAGVSRDVLIQANRALTDGFEAEHAWRLELMKSNELLTRKAVETELEIKALAGQSKELTQTLKALSEESEAAARSANELAKQTASLEKQRDGAVTRRAALEGESRSLDRELRELQRENEALKKKTDELKDESARLGKDVTRLEELRTQYLNEIAKFKEAKRRLTSM